MIQATAAQIIGQFAANLRAQLAHQKPDAAVPVVAEATPPAAARPISGLSLMARVVWRQLLALFTGHRQ
jgi:hypothetical protein